MNETELGKLRDGGVKVESHNILYTQVLFPPSMSREAIVNAVISLVHASDYDCHEIVTLPDGNIRLTIHLDD